MNLAVIQQNDQVASYLVQQVAQERCHFFALKKPGVFNVIGQKTVLDMLALAGGLKEDAGQLQKNEVLFSLNSVIRLGT